MLIKRLKDQAIFMRKRMIAEKILSRKNKQTVITLVSKSNKEKVFKNC